MMMCGFIPRCKPKKEGRNGYHHYHLYPNSHCLGHSFSFSASFFTFLEPNLGYHEWCHAGDVQPTGLAAAGKRKKSPF